jgi:EAL domain-containing protein (putative c-di-GMP-specific phosphodiesterase class I)/GGDEF domain-containing protein
MTKMEPMDTASTEELRLHALTQLKLLDTSPSESFDRITRMASRIFDLPSAAVSLTDHDRQWFKSRVGVDVPQMPREGAPCAQVVGNGSFVVIPDLLEHDLYRDSPLAKSGARFYAGAPLITREGFALGSMCVVGPQPREVSPDERAALGDLAAMVMAQIELQHAFGRIELVSGLPNRHQLLDDLHDQARDEPGAWRSLVLAELVETKRLSEAMRVLGPEAIDDLVRSSTRKISAVLAPEIVVYQVGPTQFAWLLVHADEPARDRALQKVRDQVEAYMAANAMPPLADPVLGIAPFQLGSVTGDDVLRTAHSAAQDARHADARVGIYSEVADQDHRRRFRLLADMRQALNAEDQLSLAYQPRVDMRTGACVGAEALLRWCHPVLGNISPGEFIPAVEQTELARPLTDWVIGKAIRQSLIWQEAAIAIPISVNVSAANLEENDFAERLFERLAAAGMPSSAIELEVTESAVIRDGSRVREHLRRIRAANIKVAIDDFGTGYSSLSYLKSLPADIIKIDQSFIRDLAGNARGKTLVGSMISMARSLDYHVVAEGVEDADAYEFLRSAHCDEAQGYLIARPAPPGDFARWFTDRAAVADSQGGQPLPT